MKIKNFKVEILNEETKTNNEDLKLRISLYNLAGFSTYPKGIPTFRSIRGRGIKPSESIKSSIEELMEEPETGTNDRQVELGIGSMKFNMEELKNELDHLDNTCSIIICHNRSPKIKIEEFRQ
mmetsp:Transcript_6972/g.6151  ORF Transcript_6972/g.6151 Transcript_6972/m.6151 type:complete len:123 (-) Transcript_6972:383-751(-)